MAETRLKTYKKEGINAEGSGVDEESEKRDKGEKENIQIHPLAGVISAELT
ncbi:hypothetical protein ACFL6Y_06635 [Elusimicrobiota bacterium]